MKFTNKANLPDAICNAIENDDYTKGDAKYSVSNLIQPVQIYHLVRRHFDEISIDFGDEIWKLLGKGVHSALDANKEENTYILGEERFYMKVGGIKVSGKPDITNTMIGETSDYKVTSVWKILKGDYRDWTEQLNMYRLILDRNDITVDKLKIVAILKDWKRYEQKNNENYPKVPVAQIDIPLISLLDIEKLILERVVALESAEHLTDDELAEKFPCTPEQIWQQPNKYALIKSGGKRASFILDDPNEAMAKQVENPELQLEVRKGSCVRCEEFCLASPFCKQFNKASVILPDNSPSVDILLDKINPAGVMQFIPKEPTKIYEPLPDHLHGISFKDEDIKDKKESESVLDVAFPNILPETKPEFKPISVDESVAQQIPAESAFEDRFNKMIEESKAVKNEESSKSALDIDSLFKEFNIK